MLAFDVSKGSSHCQGTAPFRPDRLDRRHRRRVGGAALRRDRRSVQIQQSQRNRRVRRARSDDPPIGQKRRPALLHNEEGQFVPQEIPLPRRGEHGHAQGGQRDHEVLLEKEKQRPLPQGGCDGGLQEAPSDDLGNASQRVLIREIV